MEGGAPTAEGYKAQVAKEKNRLYKQILIMILLSFAVSGVFYVLLFKAIELSPDDAAASSPAGNKGMSML